MIKNFSELMDKVKNMPRKVIAVAVAQDEDVIKSISKAYQEGLATAVLIGNEYKIKKIADENNVDLSNFEIIHEEDEIKACEIAVKKVSCKEADLIMKGLVHTSIILKAVLNKEANLRTGRVLSHLSLIEIESYSKMLIFTDGGMNISPNINDKSQIISNAVSVSNALDIKRPIVAVLAAKEEINPKMEATIHAKILEQMNKDGEITGCDVIGPLAMDNAISKNAAKQKGISKKGAGDADILLMPDIESGNIALKSLTFLGGAKSAGVICGAKVPIIVTSRADDEITKLHSIALASIISNGEVK